VPEQALKVSINFCPKIVPFLLTIYTTYIVYTGGSSIGAVTGGLYSGGTYTPGAQIISFTVSSIVTTIGSSRGGFLDSPGGNTVSGGMLR